MIRLLARFIVSRPRLVDWIIELAQRNPYYHLEGYMGRWWLVPLWATGKDEYGNNFPYWWWPLKIRLHHIIREDNSRHPHDHPFDFRSIVIRGWYEEMDLFGNLHTRVEGNTHTHRAEYFHTITAVPPWGVWTIFIMGRWRNKWGFIVNSRKVYWKDYVVAAERND
jgi:hypothetical protein